MVRIPGIEKFAECFKGDFSRFVVIGGTARELIYEKAGYFDDSVTKDIDVVLIAEELSPAFVDKFVAFVNDAGYEHCSKDGSCQMFRFCRPSDGSYPAQIELLSRRPDFVADIEQHIGPVPVDDSKYSLSAILMDDAYYELIASGKAVTEEFGMPTLRHEYLPLFKMRAYNDLIGCRKSEAYKHRRDVFKLMSLELPEPPKGISDAVLEDVRIFLDIVDVDKRLMRNIGLGMLEPGEMKAQIRKYYLLDCGGSGS